MKIINLILVAAIFFANAMPIFCQNNQDQINTVKYKWADIKNGENIEITFTSGNTFPFKLIENRKNSMIVQNSKDKYEIDYSIISDIKVRHNRAKDKLADLGEIIILIPYTLGLLFTCEVFHKGCSKIAD